MNFPVLGSCRELTISPNDTSPSCRVVMSASLRSLAQNTILAKAVLFTQCMPLAGEAKMHLVRHLGTVRLCYSRHMHSQDS
jgi:hypothetical protein